MSTKAVPIMVSEPPSWQFLAAPKNFLAGHKAAGSKPPDKVLPEGATDKPAEGLLFFALEKVKMKDMQLTYGGRDNRIVLKFK